MARTKSTINSTISSPPSSPQNPSPFSSSSPLQLLLSLFHLLNSILIALAYFLLIFQTIYILNCKQPKYINLRHITLKWLACIVLYQIKKGFSQTENISLNNCVAVILLDFCIIAVAYPSKILKAIHLKYFSHKEQQRYQEGVNDPNKYDLSFTGRITIGLVMFLLNLCKHLIALVLPQHRKPIQQILRQINGVVIDRKCFWSIYKNSSLQQEVVLEKEKVASKEFLVSGTALPSPRGQHSMSKSIFNSATVIPFSSREKQYIKASGEKCVFKNGIFQPIRKITLKYCVLTSQLQLLDLDFGKFQLYILQQLSEKQQNVIQFITKSSQKSQTEPIYIKFKTPRQMQHFMRMVEEGEKAY